MNTTTLSKITTDLLDPISSERREGEYLRYEGTYDRIQDARREDDHTLSQGIYRTRLKRAEWEVGEALCLEALQTRTKDLQIAGWLLEAWLHLYGFAGVETGLNLLTSLCENFWEELYPKLDGDDVEDRIAPIEWINQKLSFKLKQIPLTLTDDEDKRSYCYADWENACHFENLARRDPRALQEALATIDPTVNSFRTAMLLSAPAFHVDLVEGLNGCAGACLSLQQVLDEKCGKHSPSLHQFTEILSEIQQLMAENVRVHDDFSQIAEETPGDAIAANPGAQEIEFWSNAPIRSRADAYARLTEAADYLFRTEPHSPTPYLVKRAVEWGEMTLFELLQQIVRNEGEMQELDRLLKLSGRKTG